MTVARELVESYRSDICIYCIADVLQMKRKYKQIRVRRQLFKQGDTALSKEKVDGNRLQMRPLNS